MLSYRNGLVAYVFATCLLFFAGFFTIYINLTNRSSEFQYVLINMGFLFFIIIPVLTMRTIAEERHQKTDQLLYALPLKMSDVVLGKYLALLTVIAIPTLIIGIYPFILSRYGSVSMGTAFTSLLGFFLLAASLSSIGVLISSMTDNQALAAGLSFVVLLLVYLMEFIKTMVPGTAQASVIAVGVLVLILALIVKFLTSDTFVACCVALIGISVTAICYAVKHALFVGLFAKIISMLSLYERFNSFSDGVLDITGIVYYLSFIFVMLFLSVQTLEKRRWC